MFRCSKILNKCSENSRSQIVFRTYIFQKLTLGAPDEMIWKRWGETFTSFIYYIDKLIIAYVFFFQFTGDFVRRSDLSDRFRL